VLQQNNVVRNFYQVTEEEEEGGFKNTNLKKFLIIVPGLSLTLVSDEVAVVVTTVLADGLTVFEGNYREDEGARGAGT
jgi:hypothetical protein